MYALFTEIPHPPLTDSSQVPHDFLNIRQPVHNTALSFIHQGSATPDAHNVIVAGTAAGAVRLYDIRSQRKPVQNWDKVCPNSSVKHLQCGRLEQYVVPIPYIDSLADVDLLLRIAKSSFLTVNPAYIRLIYVTAGQPTAIRTQKEQSSPLLQLRMNSCSVSPSITSSDYIRHHLHR